MLRAYRRGLVARHDTESEMQPARRAAWEHAVTRVLRNETGGDVVACYHQRIDGIASSPRLESNTPYSRCPPRTCSLPRPARDGRSVLQRGLRSPWPVNRVHLRFADRCKVRSRSGTQRFEATRPEISVNTSTVGIRKQNAQMRETPWPARPNCPDERAMGPTCAGRGSRCDVFSERYQRNLAVFTAVLRARNQALRTITARSRHRVTQQRGNRHRHAAPTDAATPTGLGPLRRRNIPAANHESAPTARCGLLTHQRGSPAPSERHGAAIAGADDSA